MVGILLFGLFLIKQIQNKPLENNHVKRYKLKD